jgi:hypothetical protein
MEDIKTKDKEKSKEEMIIEVRTKQERREQG